MKKLDPSDRLIRYLKGCFDNTVSHSAYHYGGIKIDLTGMSKGSSLFVSKDDPENHRFYVVEYEDGNGRFKTLGEKFCLRDLKTVLPRLIKEYAAAHSRNAEFSCLL